MIREKKSIHIKKRMQLQVKNMDGSEERIFQMDRDVDDFDDVNIYVGDVQSRRGACVHIIVDKDRKYATLESAVYRASCDTKNRLQPHQGTIMMLQGVLKYLCKRYPALEYITLNDKSMVPLGNIHVTAKRLIQGRKGWYEEWLQAVPDMSHHSTRVLIHRLGHPDVQQKIQQYLPRTMVKTWGTTDDIVDLAPKIFGTHRKAVIGTAWKILRTDILAYPVRIKRIGKAEVKKGGGKQDDILWKHSIELFHMWHRL